MNIERLEEDKYIIEFTFEEMKAIEEWRINTNDNRIMESTILWLLQAEINKLFNT